MKMREEERNLKKKTKKRFPLKNFPLSLHLHLVFLSFEEDERTKNSFVSRGEHLTSLLSSFDTRRREDDDDDDDEQEKEEEDIRQAKKIRLCLRNCSQSCEILFPFLKMIQPKETENII